jgi:KDO2-lipid IV(A) lauroyltransferase
MYTPRLITDDGWGDHLRLGNLDESVRHLLRGRACLLVTGHCGNWELLGYILAVLGFDMHAVYRAIDFRALDSWLQQTRARRGLVLVDKFGIARELPRLLERGAPVGFVADQNGGDRGLFVPFFDRLASSYKSIGLAAIRANAPGRGRCRPDRARAQPRIRGVVRRTLPLPGRCRGPDQPRRVGKTARSAFLRDRAVPPGDRNDGPEGA